MPYPVGEPIRAAKIVVRTTPCASTAGPPELPWRTTPRECGDQAIDRPVPVRVAREHRRRRADPARCRGQRPVVGVAEDRDGRPGRRVSRTAAALPVAPTHAQHRDVVVRIEADDDAVVRPRAGDGDGRVALACDDMRGRDDEVPPREPAAALDADPARDADDLDDRRLGLLHPGLAHDRGARGRRRRGRPGDRRERIDAREQVQQAGRRHRVVQVAHDLGAEHLLPDGRLPGNEQGGRAGDPDDDKPRRTADDDAAE